MGSDVYLRRPLPSPRSIRLLTIYPGNFEDDICCELSVVDLTTNPTYNALSYVWNPSRRNPGSPVTSVICDGQRAKVTPNLGAALRTLRARPPKFLRGLRLHERFSFGKRKQRNYGRSIWVDALCINQEDPLERSRQVAFMTEIYSNASEVFVWLGGCDVRPEAIWGNDTQRWKAQLPLPGNHAGEMLEYLAIPLIKRVAQLARMGRFWSKDAQRWKYHLPTPRNSTWDNLRLFYENEWFRRIWVIQEAANANATILLGPNEISLDDVGLCSTWLQRNPLYPLIHDTIAPSNVIYLIRNGAPMGYLLEVTSQMHATDPRDKIYALLGLYSKWLAREPDVKLSSGSKSAFRPDYKDAVVNVYCNFVRYYLELPKACKSGQSGLRIILGNEHSVEKQLPQTRTETSMMESSDQEPLFPSWMPRWDQSLPVWSSGLVQGLRKASGDSTLHFNVKSNILSSKGFKIDQVASLKRKFDRPATPVSDSQFIERVLDEVSLEHTNYTERASLKRALASIGSVLPPAEHQPTSLSAEDSCILRFVDNNKYNYSFFVTTTGHIGIGSRAMQIGDCFCILFGGEAIFILRPMGVHYTLVGECYVPELSDGEAMYMLHSGEVEEQCFHLK